MVRRKKRVTQAELFRRDVARVWSLVTGGWGELRRTKRSKVFELFVPLCYLSQNDPNGDTLIRMVAKSLAAEGWELTGGCEGIGALPVLQKGEPKYQLGPTFTGCQARGLWILVFLLNK